ncbi:unnamed protein product [Durusdinium trenchii]|uniref:Uncharacterized protein n=1 Tax=Durusdinium trenchii TaxID=1381693 RepID=A0ABP0KA78_9DINO
MGVASKAQLQAAKADALAAANKTGRQPAFLFYRHRRVLTKKKLKHERNQVRHKRKKEKETTQRGRSESASAAASASTRRSKSMDEPMKAKQQVTPGQGSGTPGARAAAAKVPKAVRISKRGGRRLKATWRSFGVG